MAPHPECKRIILQKVQVILDAHQDIPFAYLFGSFAEGETYRDIDVAVYCDTTHPRVRDLFYDIELSQEIEKALGIPVDIVVLNHAPDHLVYRASRGILLKDENEELRLNFLLPRWKRYLDFREVIKKYRKELQGAGR